MADDQYDFWSILGGIGALAIGFLGNTITAPFRVLDALVTGNPGAVGFTQSLGRIYRLNQSRQGRQDQNPSDIEFIGIESAVLNHSTTPGGSPGSLTSLIFDITSRPDSARIHYINSTGSSLDVLGAHIKGFPVERASGERGYKHDFFVDYESIQKNSEQVLEWGNNYCVSPAQVKKIATYLWKWHSGQKHLYTVSIPGTCTYFEPGEWYTLRLGAAGTQEYIDALCECYAVRVQLAPGSVGRTSVAFRVVEQNFKDDSNAVTRYMASGGLARLRGEAVVTVAPRYSGAKADFYCDGTDDEVEINSAITALNSSFGGGTVRNLRGTYNIGSVVTLLGGITLSGEGNNTIYNQSAADLQFVQAIGTSSAFISNVIVRDIAFLNTSYGTGDFGNCIKASYVDNLLVENCLFGKALGIGIYTVSCRNQRILNNVFDSQSMTTSSAIYPIWLYESTSMASTSTAIVSSNIIRNMRCASNVFGINIDMQNVRAYYDVSGNVISNITSILTSGTVIAYGIKILGDYVRVIGNTVETVKNSATASAASGIFNSGLRNQISSNYCHNNGEDTGISNSNTDNFTDTGTSTMTNINSWQ